MKEFMFQQVGLFFLTANIALILIMFGVGRIKITHKDEEQP